MRTSLYLAAAALVGSMALAQAQDRTIPAGDLGATQPPIDQTYAHPVRGWTPLYQGRSVADPRAPSAERAVTDR